MEVRFRTRPLQRCYDEVGDAIREWGPVVGRQYVDRLS
jgi:hypothetical protein